MKNIAKTTAAVAIALSAVFTSAAAQDTVTVPATVVAGDIESARTALERLTGQSRSTDVAARARAAAAAADYALAYPDLAMTGYSIAVTASLDKEDSVRIAGVTALGRIASQESPVSAAAIANLGQTLRKKNISPAVRIATLNALGVGGSLNGGASHRAYLHAAPELKSSDAAVRQAAVEAVGAIAAAFPANRIAYNAANHVGLLLGDADPGVSAAAKKVVTQICTANTNLNCPPIP